MKPIASTADKIMDRIVRHGMPLNELLAVPNVGDARDKRIMGETLRKTAARTEAGQPVVGAGMQRAAAALLREVAAECDRRALAMTQHQATGAAA